MKVRNFTKSNVSDGIGDEVKNESHCSAEKSKFAIGEPVYWRRQPEKICP